MEVLLRRRPDPNVTHRIVGDYYTRESPEIFEALLDRYGPEIRESDLIWISPTVDGTRELPESAMVLREFWRGHASFTETILRYRVSEEEFPFVEGSIDDGWSRVTESAADAGLDGLATLCCITTIQLAYRVNRLEGRRLGTWATDLARLRIDYDAKIVDRAFDSLRTGDLPEGKNIPVQPIGQESDESNGLIGRFLNTEEDTSFSEWVEKFERQVRERTEDLREMQ
jgi:hypothetical protein